MPGKFKRVFMLGLALGMTAPASLVATEAFLKIEGVERESTRTSLSNLPGDYFSDRQVSQFRETGIITTGELISADPAVVARILRMSPEQARMLQRQMREALR